MFACIFHAPYLIGPSTHSAIQAIPPREPQRYNLEKMVVTKEEPAATEKQKKQEAAMKNKEAKEEEKRLKEGEKFLKDQEIAEKKAQEAAEKKITKEKARQESEIAKKKALEETAQASGRKGEKRSAEAAGLDGGSAEALQESAQALGEKGKKRSAEGAGLEVATGRETKPRKTPLPEPTPKVPQRPGPMATTTEWDCYYEDVKIYIPYILPSALKGFGMDIGNVALHQLAPARIEDNLVPTVGGVKMQTSRETWNPEKAVIAMETTGLYQGAGCLWWFAFPSDQCVYFQNQQLFRADNKHAAVEAAKGHWTIEAFNATGEKQHMRHFMFPDTCPTACGGIQEVQHTIPGPRDEKGEIRDIPTFHKLPLLAGWPVVLAWLETIWEAIQAGDGALVLRLYEASIVNYTWYCGKKSKCPSGGSCIIGENKLWK